MLAMQERHGATAFTGEQAACAALLPLPRQSRTRTTGDVQWRCPETAARLTVAELDLTTCCAIGADSSDAASHRRRPLIRHARSVARRSAGDARPTVRLTPGRSSNDVPDRTRQRDQCGPPSNDTCQDHPAHGPVLLRDAESIAETVRLVFGHTDCCASSQGDGGADRLSPLTVDASAGFVAIAGRVLTSAAPWAAAVVDAIGTAGICNAPSCNSQTPPSATAQSTPSTSGEAVRGEGRKSLMSCKSNIADLLQLVGAACRSERTANGLGCARRRPIQP